MEGVAKTAVRFESVAQNDVIQRFAMAEGMERLRKSAPPAPRGEGQAELGLEPAAHPFGRQIQGTQFRAGHGGFRVGFDALENRLDPVGRLTVDQFRPAPFAEAIPGGDRLIQPAEKLHVAEFRPGRTRRPANDPGGFDGGEENAVIGGIAFFPGALHFQFSGRR